MKRTMLIAALIIAVFFSMAASCYASNEKASLPAAMSVTREEVVKALWEIAGQPYVDYIMPFSDVDEESECAEAIRWAASEKIVLGYGNSKFKGKAAATSEQIALMLERFAENILGAGYDEPGEEKLPLAGGWTQKNEEITPKLQAVFDKAAAGLTGVGYKPIKLLGTQVVAGTNYKFLCEAQVVYPGAKVTKKVVTIYEDLAGNASITSIEDYNE